MKPPFRFATLNICGLAMVGLLWTASHDPASAAPTAADSFVTGGPGYSTASPLVGQGPTTTGFTGNWFEAYPGALSPDVIASGLSYNDGTRNVASAGGAMQFPSGNGRAGRLLATGCNDSTTGTVYFSVMIQPDTTGTGYRGFEMHNGSLNDGDRKLQIVTGENGSGGFIVRLFNNNDFGFLGDLGAANTNVNFFVGKFTFSTDNDGDSLQLWRNPGNLSSESGSGPATYTKTGFNLQFDRIAFARFNTDDGFKADEVRFGTTWADVTPGTYDDWKTANAGGQAPNLDFDGDGIDNGAEYFMGTAGNAFTANPAPVSGAITWPRASGTTISSFKVETSTDLGTWLDASSAYPGSVNTSNPGQVVFTLPTGLPAIFARLSVTP